MSKLVLKGIFRRDEEKLTLIAIPDSAIQFVVIEDRGYNVIFVDDNTSNFVAPKSIEENVTSFNKWVGAQDQKEKKFYEED